MHVIIMVTHIFSCLVVSYEHDEQLLCIPIKKMGKIIQICQRINFKMSLAMSDNEYGYWL